MLDFCGLDFAQVYRPMAILKRYRLQECKTALRKRRLKVLSFSTVITETFGGSGIPFEYEILRGHHALPRAFIAGGIDEDNLSRVLALNPYGVDLASSVEALPGVKDRRKMKNLVNKVRSFVL